MKAEHLHRNLRTQNIFGDFVLPSISIDLVSGIVFLTHVFHDLHDLYILDIQYICSASFPIKISGGT